MPLNSHINLCFGLVLVDLHIYAHFIHRLFLGVNWQDCWVPFSLQGHQPHAGSLHGTERCRYVLDLVPF